MSYKMTRRGKRRMLKLADELVACSRGRTLHIPGDGKAGFDMAVVAEGVLSGDTECLNGRDRGCGSACCAMGFAGVHPWFNKQGLEWRRGKNSQFAFFLNGRAAHRDWTFGDVAGKFFEIDPYMASCLFVPAGNNDGVEIDETPLQVAKRLRKFVEEHS